MMASVVEVERSAAVDRSPVAELFLLVVDVEESLGEFATFLRTYEALESCPDWVYVVRGFLERSQSTFDILQSRCHTLL